MLEQKQPYKYINAYIKSIGSRQKSLILIEGHSAI